MVLVGTSGYHFRSWKGAFYPPQISSNDMLSFYATKFDSVELNFTFYKIPTAKTLKNMVDETPEGFLFCVKLNQEMTHKSNIEVASEFLKGIEPLIETNRLGALLAQFPPSFHNRLETRRYLSNLRHLFSSLPFAAEFRHNSWQKEPLYDFLAVEQISYCSVDLPSLPTLPDRRFRFTAEPAYIRLHSRNPENWYKSEKLRYDYSYSEEELKEWVQKLETIKKQAKKAFIFFNNCEHANAPKNALSFIRLLDCH
ncbi:MAG: DUF72 domain-containing protein [Planctomycetota bacterium]|nr:DUF72 domain-containing protein [Planctomycetota bacterium]